jgi:hypothetical protein
MEFVVQNRVQELPPTYKYVPNLPIYNLYSWESVAE